MSSKKFIKMIKPLNEHDIMNFRVFLENIKFACVCHNYQSPSSVWFCGYPRGNECPNALPKKARLFTVTMKLDRIDPVIDIINEENL